MSAPVEPRQDENQCPPNGRATVDLAVTFQALEHQWKMAVGHLSNPTKMTAHPAFQAIIALGTPVIPLLLQELEKEPFWAWFMALEKITGQDPVPKEDAMNVEKAAAAWLRWGCEKGYFVEA